MSSDIAEDYIAEDYQPLSMFLHKFNSRRAKNTEGAVDKRVVNVLKRNRKHPKGSSKEASMTRHEHEAVSREMPITFDDQDRYDNESGDERHLRLAAVIGNTCSSLKQQDERILPALGTNWPFVKTLPIWRTLESNQIFKLMPQHPHFLPLEQYNEEIREGEAIGNMFNFINLVEQTLKAKLIELRSVFENRLKVLADLEEHGFVVQPIRILLEKIVRKKLNYCELHNQQKMVEREIGEGKHKLYEIDMKLQTLLKDREKEITTLAEREKEMAEIKKQLQNVELDFDNMIVSPLVSINCE